jgi:hypothetical protein
MIFVSHAGTSEFISRLRTHYLGEDQKRLARLAREQLWVVPDLLSIFTDWISVLKCMKANLQRAKISSWKRSLPIGIQTRLLHNQMETAVELGGVLRNHQAICERVNKLIDDSEDGSDGELSKRIELIMVQIAFTTTKIDAIRGQLKKLIQLVRFAK